MVPVMDKIQCVSRRSTVAVSMLEVICGILIMVPCILVVLDLATIYEGFCLNNNACLEAVKAASSGPPNAISPGTPKDRAEAAVRRHHPAAATFAFSTLCKVQEDVMQPLPGAPLGGAVDGQVTVETTLTVRPPFLIGIVVGKHGIPLTASKTFPYTYTVPATQQDASATQSFAISP